MPKPPPPITDAEWDVMDVLWDQSPATAQEVHGILAGRKDWGVGTVKTLLARLLRKGALRHEQEGKRYLYSPTVSRDACVLDQSRGLLGRARGAISPLLACFLREGRLDAEDIAELKALLAEREEEDR